METVLFRHIFIGELFFGYIYLLFHFLGAEIKVAVANPLDLKPVPEVIVAAALELHLQAVDVLLLEAAAWGVRVLVEPNAVP